MDDNKITKEEYILKDFKKGFNPKLRDLKPIADLEEEGLNYKPSSDLEEGYAPPTSENISKPPREL